MSLGWQGFELNTSEQPVSETSERQLLERWVDEHADALYRFALARIGDSHLIEDLLQETYLAAIRSHERFRGDSTVQSWLIGILRLKIVDHFRRQSRSKETGTLDEALVSSEFVREDRLTEWNVSAFSPMERKEFWDAFQDCLDKLPENLGIAYFMREMDGLSVEQVCHNLEISSKNLAVRLFRARTLLRDCLDRNWFMRESK